ncbi:hypothetical protein SO802_022218 [Lithocarpus litseifolius]|uniref:Uncharacterized protein n=1 Tax=Lithocarpus litseifolius TaxID=425828 RepID=A0AAW2CJF3_9ROSI
MSWGLGWKRPSEIFHLALSHGNEESVESPGRVCSSSSASSSSMGSASRSSSALSMVAQDQELGFRIELEWAAGDGEEQVALKLQSQLMVELPMPQDTVEVVLKAEDENVAVEMTVVMRREPLRAVTMTKVSGSGQQSDGTGVLTRLLRAKPSTNALPP